MINSVEIRILYTSIYSSFTMNNSNDHSSCEGHTTKFLDPDIDIQFATYLEVLIQTSKDMLSSNRGIIPSHGMSVSCKNEIIYSYCDVCYSMSNEEYDRALAVFVITTLDRFITKYLNMNVSKENMFSLISSFTTLSTDSTIDEITAVLQTMHAKVSEIDMSLGITENNK